MHLFLHIFIFDFLPVLSKPLTTYPPSIQKIYPGQFRKDAFYFFVHTLTKDEICKILI